MIFKGKESEIKTEKGNKYGATNHFCAVATPETTTVISHQDCMVDIANIAATIFAINPTGHH